MPRLSTTQTIIDNITLWIERDVSMDTHVYKQAYEPYAYTFFCASMGEC